MNNIAYLIPDTRDEDNPRLKVIYAKVAGYEQGGCGSNRRFFETLSHVVTEWIQTEYGKFYWGKHGEKFDLHDLFFHYNDPDFRDILRSHGIFDMAVEDYALNFADVEWTWDTDLTTVSNPAVEDNCDSD
jgi:hypothetical protein